MLAKMCQGNPRFKNKFNKHDTSQILVNTAKEQNT